MLRPPAGPYPANPMPALIFDFDGVIMNSEPLHERTIRAAVESVGLTMSHEDFIRVAVGTADMECMRRLAAEQGRALTEDQLAAMAAMKREMFRQERERGAIEPFPGTVRLMREAAADPRIDGVAVCTGSRRIEAEAQLRGIGVWDVLRGCITRESVTRIKPDPEPYLRACACVGLPPRECIAIEDTVPGVRSALAAGLRVAAVCHTLPASALREAHRVFESTEEMTVDDLLGI